MSKRMDLISRRAAIDALKVAYFDEKIQSGKDDPCVIDAMTDWSIRQIKALPPAQPEAQWVQMFINPNMYKCSNCQVAWNKRLVFDNEGYSEDIFMKYCPCCGRKMKTEVGYE